MTRRRFQSRWLPAAAAPILAGSLWLTLAAPATGEWPQYRGPDRTGISEETGILKTWPESGPEVLWRAELGNGYSGIAVSGGRAFTMYGRGDGEFVAAYDPGTGKELWRARTGKNRADDQGGGPRATPTVDGDRVYALGASGDLVAVSAGTGEVAWRVDLKSAVGARVPRWGVSTSPLVEDDLLILDAGGPDGKALVALDKRNGKVRWTAFSDKPGYSAPLAATIHGVRQVISFGGTALVSAALEDGKELWSFPWKTSYDVNAAMPIFVPPDKVFISSAYDTGAALLRVEKSDGGLKVSEVWRSRVMKNHFNSSILYGGHLYGFDNGVLKCIDASTGDEKWKQSGFAKGSLILADGHLVILSERGLLALAEATPAGYKEAARAQILQGKTWTMPSLADGRLYLRTEEEMVALKVRP